MPSRLPLAPLLGALVHLTRYEPHAGEARSAVLSAIRGLLNEKPLRITAEREALLLDDERIGLSLPGATLLHEQLLLHGVGSIELPAAMTAAELSRLMEVLAAFPGAYRDQSELTAALGESAQRIRVRAADPDLEVYRLSGKTRISAKRPSPDEDELGIQHEDAEAITAEEESEEGHAKLPESVAIPTRPPLGAILGLGRNAVAQENWEHVLDAGLQLMEAEDEAPSERTGRTYRMELKRLITSDHLPHIARLAHGERRQEVSTLLRRFGTEGTEALVDLLVNAESLAERRSYYTAITQMRAGAEAILGRLDDQQWFVVRNAAELCGDMEIEDAVPSLGRQHKHQDERVRRSVAGALARIGTPLALEWLRKMLHDPSATVRRHALMQLAGAPARPLTAALAELLEREEDPEVQREAMLALGRSGSEPAVAALEIWAAPVSRRYGRNRVALRLQAIRALAVAGPNAINALTNLSRDAAEEVRTAATEALAGLRG